jgi:hypothetical protein
MSGQINLYDARLRRQREWLTATNLALAALVLLLIVGGVGGWARSQASDREATVAALQPQAKALQDQLLVLAPQVSSHKPDAALEQELAAAKGKVESNTAILAMLQKGLGPGAVSFSTYLSGFVRQTPSGVWLTGFSVDGDGSGMEIRGRTVDPALVPQYIKRLNGEKAFQGRAFSALQVSIPAPIADSATATATPTGVAASSKPAVVPYHEFTLTPEAPTGKQP